MGEIEAELKLVPRGVLEVDRPKIDRDQLTRSIADEAFRERGFDLRRDRDVRDRTIDLLVHVFGAESQVRVRKRLPIAAQLHHTPSVGIEASVAAGDGVDEY